MAKVTSKLQVTIPKLIAVRYGIQPGDDIGWEPAGESIRVVPPGARVEELSREERLALFDAATDRQHQREADRTLPSATTRGWTRDALYDRGDRGKPR